MTSDESVTMNPPAPAEPADAESGRLEHWHQPDDAVPNSKPDLIEQPPVESPSVVPHSGEPGPEPDVAESDVFEPLVVGPSSKSPDPDQTGDPAQTGVPDVASERQTESAGQKQIDALPVSENIADDIRARMIDRFTQWLDQSLAGDPPPRGLPEHLLAEATAMVADRAPSNESDLYTLFSALTALTGEIKLQGRAFKQLADLLLPLAEVPTAMARLHEVQLETVQGVQAVADAQAARDEEPEVDFKQTCDLMIDLYDRLARGVQTCDDGIESLRARGNGGWLAKRLGLSDSIDRAVESVQAIRDASELAVARLQAALLEWGVQRIGKAGEPFDPGRMTAVDVRADGKVPPGTVLVVNRSGYAVHGTVKLTAQVTVSKA